MKQMKIRLKLLLILLAGIMLYLPSNAQGSLKFSLKEAQEYAKQNSYVVKNTGLDVAKAQKKVWETISTGLPQVSADASYMSFLDLAVSLIPGEFFGEPAGTYLPVKFGQDYSSNYGFKVDQLIFDGSYIVGVGSSQIYLNLAKHAKEKSEIDIANAVEQSYYMVLIAEENLKIMEENLENSTKLLNDTELMYENGFVEEQDVDQMKLLVKSSENQVLKAEREIRISKMVLKYAMGVDVDINIVLAENLSTHLNPLIEDYQSSGGFDFTSHIDYRLMNTQTRAAEKLLLLEKSAYLPRLSGFYSWTKTAYGNEANLFKSDVDWFKSSMVGLNISMPIFNSGMKKSKVNQAKLDLEKAKNDQKLAEQTLQKDFLSAVADLQNAKEQYKNEVDSKELARKIFDKTTIKYNNGISGSTELAQVESQYIQAQGAYIASVMQLLNSKVNLDKAVGKY